MTDLQLINLKRFKDERGFFEEFYKGSFPCPFVQDNHSYSRKGVIRGMHFQETPGQAKLVSVIQGRIYDVCVDIRRDSPTFGQWKGFFLDAEEPQQLFVPVGFAHGFAVLSDSAHVIYKVSTFYDPQTERGFRYDDPSVGIEWPVESPILSDKDRTAPAFAEVVR